MREASASGSAVPPRVRSADAAARAALNQRIPTRPSASRKSRSCGELDGVRAGATSQSGRRPPRGPLWRRLRCGRLRRGGRRPCPHRASRRASPGGIPRGSFRRRLCSPASRPVPRHDRLADRRAAPCHSSGHKPGRRQQAPRAQPRHQHLSEDSLFVACCSPFVQRFFVEQEADPLCGSSRERDYSSRLREERGFCFRRRPYGTLPRRRSQHRWGPGPRHVHRRCQSVKRRMFLPEHRQRHGTGIRRRLDQSLRAQAREAEVLRGPQLLLSKLVERLMSGLPATLVLALALLALPATASFAQRSGGHGGGGGFHGGGGVSQGGAGFRGGGGGFRGGGPGFPAGGPRGGVARGAGGPQAGRALGPRSHSPHGGGGDSHGGWHGSNGGHGHDGHGDGGHGHDGHGHDWGHGHGGHWHGSVFVGGPWWYDPWWGWPYPYAYAYPYYGVYGYPYAYYPPPYYPGSYPYPGGSTEYIQREPQTGEHPAGYWYYCASSKGYYPTVQQCPEDWIKVPPAPR